MKKKFCVVLAMLLILFSMTGGQIINNTKAEPLANLCNDELLACERVALSRLQFPFRPFSYPDEKNEVNTFIYELASGKYSQEEIESKKEQVYKYIDESPVYDVEFDGYDARMYEKSEVDFRVSLYNDSSAIDAIKNQIYKDYPDISEEQMENIFCLRYANRYYDDHNARLLYFKEAEYAGLVDETSPKLTLQQAKDIIERHDPLSESREILNDFLTIQQYPDEIYNTYDPSSNMLPTGPYSIISYVRFESENTDGSFDDIWVTSGTIFHFKLDANHDVVEVNKLLSIPTGNSFFKACDVDLISNIKEFKSGNLNVQDNLENSDEELQAKPWLKYGVTDEEFAQIKPWELYNSNITNEQYYELAPWNEYHVSEEEFACILYNDNRWNWKY